MPPPRPLPPVPPTAPTPPMAWFPSKVLPKTLVTAPRRVAIPPPTPGPATEPPALPAPPTAWLLVNVELLTVRVETSAATKETLKLEIAPPAPRLKTMEPLPARLPLPPRASLWSNVLFVTVATDAATLDSAPPLALPTRPRPLAPPVALDPPTARL